MTTGSRYHSLVYTILLGSLGLLFFAEAAFTSRTFISRDNYLFFNPRRFFAAETVSSGTLPLWNPYIACGVPFQANLQSSVLYPLSAVYYLLPFQTGFKYFIMLHYCLAALFMFLLMRGWGSGRYAAFFAGMVFSLGGYMVSICDNVSFLTAGAWLPLILYLHHRSLKTGSLRWTMLASLAVGMQVFAGDASFYLLASFIILFGYTVFWQVSSPVRLWPAALRMWGAFALCWAAGLALAGVQLLPFLEFAMQSTRWAGLSFEQVTKWSFHPVELLQLLTPFAFGSIVPAARWFGQLWLDTIYMGIFPLAFAVLFALRGRGWLKYFLVTLVATGILLGLGKNTPLFMILYRLVPGASTMMFPVKFLFIASFALAVMSGWGVQLFLQLTSARTSLHGIMKPLLAPLLLLLSALLCAAVWKDEAYAFFLTFYPATDYMRPLREMHFFSLYSGMFVAAGFLLLFFVITGLAIRFRARNHIVVCLITAVVYLDLAVIGKPHDPLVEEATIGQKNTVLDFLQTDESLYRIYSLSRIATKKSYMHLHQIPFEKAYRVINASLPANINMYHHLYSIDEYSALLRNDFYDIFTPLESAFSRGRPSLSEAGYCKKMFDLLNVKYIISPFPLQHPGLRQVRSGPIHIYANQTALPRAFCVSALTVAATDSDVLRLMRSPLFNPAETVFVTESEFQKLDRKGESAPGTASGPFAWSAVFTSYATGTVSLTCRASAPGFLILSDSYYPGWEARVNGNAVPILRVNHCIRAIPVRPGSQKITFVFRPPAFTTGALLSLGALGFIIIVAVLAGGESRESGLTDCPAGRHQTGRQVPW